MAKYKVNFSGFAYVEADDPDEAKELVEDGQYAYMEYESDAEEVDDFEVII